MGQLSNISIKEQEFHNMLKLKFLFGPGFITGAADNDPSAIAAYTQTGAQYGYKQLWTVLFTWPITILLQEMCVRISIVNQKGIATVLKIHYHKILVWMTSIILLIINTVNIGADLSAMAECANLIYNLNFYFYLALFVVLIILLEVFLSYKKYSRILLIFGSFMFLYIAAGFIIKVEWNKALMSTVVPHIEINKEYFLNLIAIIGTTISPYMFFWQPAQELEEIKLKSGGNVIINNKGKELRINRLETIFGMFLTNFNMYFIILVGSAVLHANGITDINTANEAAKALEPIAGEFASLIFSLGVIGLGLISVPVLAASSAFVFSGAFSLKKGLNKKFQSAKGFYSIIIASILTGLFISISPVKPFKLLYYSAAISGFFAPILIAILTLVASNKKIMGRHVNRIWQTIACWCIFLLLIISAITFIIYNL